MTSLKYARKTPRWVFTFILRHRVYKFDPGARGVVCGGMGGEVTPPITKTSKFNPPNIYTTVNGNLESGYLLII